MSRRILLVGAGKSTSYLLDYLLEHSGEENLEIIIADKYPEAIPEQLHNHPNSSVIGLDISDSTARRAEIDRADIVISMLPARLHLEVAKDCLEALRKGAGGDGNVLEFESV